jgi:hypothetical protein
MVLMEAALVTNETLAYLAFSNGLQQYMNHRDPSLPGRIDNYGTFGGIFYRVFLPVVLTLLFYNTGFSVLERGRGLWGTDPPKSIADIVESTLGAIHVYGGFDAGQAAALKVIRPVIDVLQASVCDSTAIMMRHPRRSLLELGGKLTSIWTLNEGNFCREMPDCSIWDGQRWGKPHREGNRAVACVSLLGKEMMTVVDETPSSASNRASALILMVLTNSDMLMQAFVEARAKVMSTADRTEKEEGASAIASSRAA